MSQKEQESVEEYIQRVAAEMGYPKLPDETVEAIKANLHKPKRKKRKRKV